MAFSQFKSLGEAAKRLRFLAKNATFMSAAVSVEAPAALRERLAIILEEGLHRISEAARCEMLIAPLLCEVWLRYRAILKLWSHAPLEYDVELVGTPDYLIAKQSEFGFAVIGSPILVAVEAKQDNFEYGWGQCAAEMIAIQKLNGDSVSAVFGIVTNGETWQFGKLEGTTLTQETAYYGMSDLDRLFGALTFVMEECYKQVTQTQALEVV